MKTTTRDNLHFTAAIFTALSVLALFVVSIHVA